MSYSRRRRRRRCHCAHLTLIGVIIAKHYALNALLHITAVLKLPPPPPSLCSSLPLDIQSLARRWRHNWCASTYRHTYVQMWVSGAIRPLAGLSVAVVGHHCRLHDCPTAATTHRHCWLLFSCTLIFWDFQ